MIRSRRVIGRASSCRVSTGKSGLTKSPSRVLVIRTECWPFVLGCHVRSAWCFMPPRVRSRMSGRWPASSGRPPPPAAIRSRFPLGLPRRCGITEARDRPKSSQRAIRQTRRRGRLRFGATGRVAAKSLRAGAKPHGVSLRSAPIMNGRRLGFCGCGAPIWFSPRRSTWLVASGSPHLRGHSRPSNAPSRGLTR